MNAIPACNVNVNVNLYSASSQKRLMRSMYRVLIKDTSSVYDENGQFACPAHANCFGTSSMSLDDVGPATANTRSPIELKPWNNELRYAVS